MRLLSVGTGIRRWLGGLRTQPVVLSSECPPGDCAARLVRVTAQRGLGVWYRDPQNYLYHRGDPRLLGTVDAGHVSVVHYPEGAGRNSFAALLQGQLQPAADGGTTLTGTIGLHPAVGVGLPVMAVVWGAVVLVPFAVGIARLVTGHMNGLLLTILSPLFWAVPALGIMVIGGGLAPARHPEADRRDVRHLGRELDIPESARRAIRRGLDIPLIAADARVCSSAKARQRSGDHDRWAYSWPL